MLRQDSLAPFGLSFLTCEMGVLKLAFWGSREGLSKMEAWA